MSTKNLSVEKYGIKDANVRYQLTADELHAETLAKGLGKEASSGALAVNTGKFTGRSPQDRFIVEDSITKIVYGGEKSTSLSHLRSLTHCMKK